MTTCRKCGYFYKGIEDFMKHQKEKHQYVYKEKNEINNHERVSNLRKTRSSNMPRSERMERTFKRKASPDYRRHHQDEE